MRQLPLNVKAYTILDSNGNGTAFTGPMSPGEYWENMTASVSVATDVSESSCNIYAGAAATPGYLADGTFTGSKGNSTTNLSTVRVGGNVWAVWTGGDAGSRATLALTGTKTVN